MSLPNVEIPSSNGDPRDYHMFITTFDQAVGNVLSSDQAKLTKLYQYLSGEARSVNLVTDSSSMNDDVVPSVRSPKLGPTEERMSDVSSMQVNHVMMDEPSDRVDKLWNIERQDETVCSWSVEDNQVHDMMLTETGPVLKEPESG